MNIKCHVREHVYVIKHWVVVVKYVTCSCNGMEYSVLAVDID
jgi:hypothetical protein